ncbi:16S rRNA (cytidine(1402)-2'-O)-methyltransferase [Actinomyces bowdenii]|uniref:16S rRNA (cytidine(1402)-2'-O)-methyltransferase n=1 Tax=Actinomyces bowdenii TaxID=131109 RepID=UPI001ABC16C7|nr:16S rRNA (cytidine(1402)-2'-O)-methyltransferase [Actinomyces bowdenii]MBO3725417.1 16S rRNA (cytidine(1402)-2'-O)-methyltransferase [Actinomyces bowdenii]
MNDDGPSAASAPAQGRDGAPVAAPAPSEQGPGPGVPRAGEALRESGGPGPADCLRPGVITLAATPIGNAADASARLRAALGCAGLIAAEDTRRLRALAQRLGVEITGRVVSLHEHNERRRAGELIEAARAGHRILVVSDAGMPSVSDPGYRLVRAAVQAGVEVTSAPGPSAVLSALALSGLASDRFCFEGFLPRRPGERRRAITALSGEERTMVLFESPRRVHETITMMAEILGQDRPAALCRELTKTHEEIRRATLGELARSTEQGVLGEVVLVVAGARPAEADPREAARTALSLAEQGMRLKDAAGQAARSAGLRPNDVYREALALRQERAAQ